jgi:hypothetical protein
MGSHRPKALEEMEGTVQRLMRAMNLRVPPTREIKMHKNADVNKIKNRNRGAMRAN